jgi:hypothetical protein
LPARITYDFPWYVFEKYDVLNANFNKGGITLIDSTTNQSVDLHEVFRDYLRLVLDTSDIEIEFLVKDNMYPLTPFVTHTGSGLQYSIIISFQKQDGTIIDVKSRFILPFHYAAGSDVLEGVDPLFIKASEEYATSYAVLHPYIAQLKSAKDDKEEQVKIRQKLADTLIKLTRGDEKFLPLPKARIVAFTSRIDERIKLIPYLMFFSRYNGTYNFKRSGFPDIFKISNQSNEHIVASVEDFRKIPGNEVYAAAVIKQRIAEVPENSRGWFVERMLQFIKDSGNGKASTVVRGVIMDAKGEGLLSSDTSLSFIGDTLSKRMTIQTANETAAMVAIDETLFPKDILMINREIIRLLCTLDLPVDASNVNDLLSIQDLHLLLYMNAFDLLKFKDAVMERMHSQYDSFLTSVRKELNPQKYSSYHSLYLYLGKARKIDNAERYPRQKARPHSLGKQKEVPDDPKNDDQGNSVEEETKDYMSRRLAVIERMKKRERRNEAYNDKDRPKPVPQAKNNTVQKSTYQAGEDKGPTLVSRAVKEHQTLSEKYSVDQYWKDMLMRLPFKTGEREKVLAVCWELEMAKAVSPDQVSHPSLLRFKKVLNRAERVFPKKWYELFDKLVVSYRREKAKVLTLDDMQTVTDDLRFIYAYHVWFDAVQQINLRKQYQEVLDAQDMPLHEGSPRMMRENVLRDTMTVLSSNKMLTPNPIFVTTGHELREVIGNYQLISQDIAWNIWRQLKAGVFSPAEIKRNVLAGKGVEYIAKYPKVYERLQEEIQRRSFDHDVAMKKLLSIELGKQDNLQRTMIEHVNAIHAIKSA